MIARAGSGWQYALADLSLILFLVTASALSTDAARSGPAAPAPLRPPLTPSPTSEPLAIYRADGDAPPMGEWLAAQSPDPRQQLTIVAQYRAGGQARALEQARQLAASAGQAGMAARIVIEPGSGGTVATLAYDVPAADLARDLRARPGHPPVEGTPP